MERGATSGRAALRMTRRRVHLPRLSAAARRDFLRSVVAAFPDAMMLVDPCGSILAFIDSEKGMLGHGPHDLIGQNITMLMPLPDREQHGVPIRDFLHSGERCGAGYQNLVRVCRKNGEILPVDLSLHATMVEGARMYVAFMHNATVREEQRQRLAQISADLAHATRLSSMGLLSSAIAHELNQPLTAIRNYVETISAMAQQHGALDTGLLVEVMRACDAEATRASEIIRRLRQFISRGEPEHARVSLTALITDAITLALADSEATGPRIDIVIDPTGDEVLVDAIAIQQVVFNLVRNALQAMADSDERHLRIWSKLRGTMVEVVVEDSGTGITPDHEEQLFLPFNTKKINGLGLGLTIVKMIVEAHGGRIGVGASAWGGCAFRFTIPVVPSMMMEGANERGSKSLSDR